MLQEHYELFVRFLRFRVSSRDEFERLRALPADRLTDFQRAARFLYLQRLAFGGKVVGRNFGVSAGQSARFNALRLEPQLEAIYERFAAVVIERLPYGEFIRRYDRAGMLFYLDPPYWGCEEDYGQDVFGRADFERLAEQLRGIKGRFLLSINDTPGVREVFAGFPMQTLDVTYQIGAGAPRTFGELIIG